MSDLDPPPYRGRPGSTFQHWEFSAEPGYETMGDGDVTTDPMQPEVDQNPFTLPYGPPSDRPWLVVRPVDPPKIEWLQGYAGRQGVWRLEPEFRMFGRIPNAGRPERRKQIRVQLTWYRVTTSDPTVSLSWRENSGTPLQGPPRRQRDAGQGWTHATWDFEIDCTSEELIEIECEDVVYIDQLVVDTICEPTPDEPRRKKN